jgi:hypothetical protein
MCLKQTIAQSEDQMPLLDIGTGINHCFKNIEKKQRPNKRSISQDRIRKTKKYKEERSFF